MRMIGHSAILATVLACSGCSFFIRNPPDKLPDDPAEHIHCTTSVGAPVVDAVIGGIGGYTAVYIVSEDVINPPQNRTAANIAVPAILAGATAVYLVSAAVGYGHVAKCVEMKELQKERREKDQ